MFPGLGIFTLKNPVIHTPHLIFSLFLLLYKYMIILKPSDDSQKAYLENLKSLLLKNGSVKVTGLGVFVIKLHAGRNVKSFGGELVAVKPFRKIGFKATKELKDKAQKH